MSIKAFQEVKEGDKGTEEGGSKEFKEPGKDFKEVVKVFEEPGKFQGGG